MTVLIDADGCPVVDITIEICSRYNVPCTLLCDTSHEFHRANATILVFDKGADSVDYALVNRVEPGDLVITQDYGLASMCLARNARILHQDGWEYTIENIDTLLLVRHNNRKYRVTGGHIKGQRKRKNKQNEAFTATLIQILQNNIQG